jgi:hypothetical protein
VRKSILGSLGVLSTIAFIPRLSVDPSGSRLTGSPMKTVFSLSNDGLLPVHDVKVSCDVQRLTSSYHIIIEGIRFAFPDSTAETLSPGQKISLPCDRVVDGEDGSIVDAELTITVTYRPDFVWWYRSIQFHVVAQKGGDGTWLWRRLPN